jgi:hypothetical protein
MLSGGLLPFPRTGCVLYAKAIVSYCPEIRQVAQQRLSRLAAILYCGGRNVADNRGGVTSPVNLNRRSKVARCASEHLAWV